MTHSLPRPSVSVIVPVYNGGEKFRKCLDSLKTTSPLPDESIVVADGDTDGSWRMAEEYGMQVLRLSTPGGPARARNLGARSARGDILFFVDADVTIPPDAIDHIVHAFQGDPLLSAVFGSYDDEPYESNFLSQYKNLFHHYVHQTSEENASTFWGACGAIRHEVFLEVGGFDEAYRHASIEDIDLGYRLRSLGKRIRILKGLQVKHLKRWGVSSLLMADLFYRGLPWTNLILNSSCFINDLNLKISSRISVIFLYVLLMSSMGALFIPWLSIFTALCAAGLVVINWDLYRFYERKRGFRFVLKTIPWHWLYLFYCGLAFGIGLVRHWFRRFHEQRAT